MYQSMEERVKAEVESQGSINKAAAKLGMARSTAQKYFRRANDDVAPETHTPGNQVNVDFEWPNLPDPNTPIDELVDRKISDFDRFKHYKQATKMVRVKVRSNKPIGLACVGDPHVDDDGCNIRRLLRDADTVRETPGMYGMNVGDHNNLWPGRLASKYADQITRADDGWRLTEHVIERFRDWLALMKGNHDHFVGQGDPLDWIRRPVEAYQEPYNIRLCLEFPNGREFRIWLRHDFAGNSQWNGLHGMVKAAKMGAGMHLLVGGHRHDVGHHSEYDPYQGLYFHCLRTSGYKEMDDHAEKCQFEELSNLYACPVMIVDPEASNEADFAEMIRNPQRAAKILTKIREDHDTA